VHAGQVQRRRATCRPARPDASSPCRGRRGLIRVGRAPASAVQRAFGQPPSRSWFWLPTKPPPASSTSSLAQAPGKRISPALGHAWPSKPARAPRPGERCASRPASAAKKAARNSSARIAGHRRCLARRSPSPRCRDSARRQPRRARRGGGPVHELRAPAPSSRRKAAVGSSSSGFLRGRPGRGHELQHRPPPATSEA
jgi:hypothetical protein